MTNTSTLSIYFPYITAILTIYMYLYFFEKFDTMSNSAIVHHNLHVAIQNGTCLIIYS